MPTTCSSSVISVAALIAAGVAALGVTAKYLLPEPKEQSLEEISDHSMVFATAAA